MLEWQELLAIGGCSHTSMDKKAKSRSNPLYRHDIDKHNGETQVYKCRILNTEKNLLPLCILEGLYIEKQDPTQRLNERNESGRGGLVRMIASRITWIMYCWNSY